MLSQGLGNLKGNVIDTNNNPLLGINLKIKGSKLGTATNEQGNFSIENIPTGTYSIVATAINYESQSKEVVITSKEKNIVVNFELKNSNIKLKEVTITTTGVVKSSQDIPGSISIINQKRISESGAQNIGEIIATAPGVNFLDEDGRGLKPNIGLRGLNPNRNRSVLVLEDGKFPVGTTLYGDVGAYYFTPIQQIDRIEIIRGGAASVLYGGYSVGGVINLISKKATYKPETKVDLTLGSFNLLTAQVTTGKDDGKTSYFFNAFRRQGDSFRKNGDFEVNDISGKYAVRPDSTSQLSVYVNGFNEVSQTPGGLSQAEFEEDLTQSNNDNDDFYSKRFSVSTDYSKNINQFNSFNVSVYGSYFERDWFIATTGDTRKGYVRDIHNGGLVADYKLTKDLFGFKNSLIVGTRIHTDRLNSNTLLQETGDFTSQIGTITASSVNTSFTNEYYAYNELKIKDKFIITPGVRYTSINYNSKNLFSATENSINNVSAFIGTLGVVYKLKTNTSIFANVSNGFQPPSLSNAVNGSTLDAGIELNPEKSVNYEIGFKTQPTNWISASTTAYYIDFDDRIIRTDDVYKNTGKTLHRGVEAEIELGAWHGLSFFTNVTIQKATYENGDELDGNIVEYSPQQMFASGIRSKIDLKHGNIVANIFGNYVGKQYHDDENTEEGTDDGSNGAIPSYKVVNGTIGYTAKNWGINVALYNMFNEEYFTKRQSFFGGILPSSSKNVRLNLTYKF